MSAKRIYKAKVDSIELLDNGNLRIAEIALGEANRVEVTKDDAVALIRILQDFVDGEYDAPEGGM